MSEKLLPCPWPDCEKDEATLDSVVARDLYELWAVTCPHCERSVEGKDGSRQGAIDAYNSLPRTVQAAPSDRENRWRSLCVSLYCHGGWEAKDHKEYDALLALEDADAALADTTNNDGGG